MKILHLDLREVDGEFAELRYFWENPIRHEPRRLRLNEIAELLARSQEFYYTWRCFQDREFVGQQLYAWLDGSDRWLQQKLDEARQKEVLLAIATARKLAHLPWEVLHDGSGFLIERRPAIVPARWLADVPKLTLQDAPRNRPLNLLFMAASPQGVEPVLSFEREEAQILKATQRYPLCLTVEESGCTSELKWLADIAKRGIVRTIS